MPIWAPAFFGSAASGSSGFVVEDSVYFDGTADRLTFDPSGATSTPDLFCISYWAKRSGFGATYYNVMSGGANGYDSTLRYSNYSTYREALNFSANGGPDRLITTAAFADPTAWHHVFARYDSNASGGSSAYLQLWVNGVRLTSFADSGMPSTGEDSTFFDGNIIAVGGYNHSAQTWFSGYLAEVAASDGQNHVVTDFGEYSDSGVWIPKDITGLTYGTNGFLLQFKQTGSGQDASGIGADTSGNNNHFAIAGGSPQSQQVTDTCTDDASSNIGNYVTWSSIDKDSNVTLSEGNRVAEQDSTGAFKSVFATQAVPSTGKWVWEVKQSGGNPFGGYATTGVASTQVLQSVGRSGSGTITFDYQSSASKIRKFGGGATEADYAGSVSMSSGEAFQFAIDSDAETLEIYINNTKITDSGGAAGASGTFDISSLTKPYKIISQLYSGGTVDHTLVTNSADFENNVPSGYKTLNTANLPALTVTDPRKYFGTLLWAGDNASTRDIVKDGSGITGDVDFTPDFCWIKGRNVQARNKVFDVLRGTSNGKDINTDQPDQEGTETTNGFVSDFKVGGVEVTRGSSNAYYYNNTGTNYLGFFWKAGDSNTSVSASGSGEGAINACTHRANTTSGLSIIKYTGKADTLTSNGQHTFVTHGLGSAPVFMMGKNVSSSSDWFCLPGEQDATGSGRWGADNHMMLNKIDDSDGGKHVQPHLPNSTSVFVGRDDLVNKAGDEFIMYAWIRVPGLVGYGTYVAGGSSYSPVIQINDGGAGFKPAWLMIKRVTADESWFVFNNQVDQFNPSEFYIMADSDVAENSGTGGNDIDFLANGFTCKTTNAGTNSSGTYLYLAFAENPFGGEDISQAKAR